MILTRRKNGGKEEEKKEKGGWWQEGVKRKTSKHKRAHRERLYVWRHIQI